VGVIAHRVRVAVEEELGLDAAAVALERGRLCVDEARELADRMLVAIVVDERLPLFGRALRGWPASTAGAATSSTTTSATTNAGAAIECWPVTRLMERVMRVRCRSLPSS
jgi:hypothetical protein